MFLSCFLLSSIPSTTLIQTLIFFFFFFARITAKPSHFSLYSIFFISFRLIDPSGWWGFLVGTHLPHTSPFPVVLCVHVLSQVLSPCSQPLPAFNTQGKKPSLPLAWSLWFILLFLWTVHVCTLQAPLTSASVWMTPWMKWPRTDSDVSSGHSIFLPSDCPFTYIGVTSHGQSRAWVAGVVWESVGTRHLVATTVSSSGQLLLMCLGLCLPFPEPARCICCRSIMISAGGMALTAMQNLKSVNKGT